MRSFGTLTSVLAISLAAALPLQAKTLPGMAELFGNVAGDKSAIVPVYIYNTDKHVGYAVFAVNGQYRAVDLFPDGFETTFLPAVLTMRRIRNPTAESPP